MHGCCFENSTLFAHSFAVRNPRRGNALPPAAAACKGRTEHAVSGRQPLLAPLDRTAAPCGCPAACRCKAKLCICQIVTVTAI
ncbi:MAG: hypothetical protein IJU56_08765 [Clostridia bacterium]|nr:hypothetical protein [Clostridia bacterium]